MSLTSYRAAPPRANGDVLWRDANASAWLAEAKRLFSSVTCEGFSTCMALASKPGGDLLFHRLSDSTIGAVWFHGRVRDGIGWVTDAMATKLWGQRNKVGSVIDACTTM
jgi:hypothetical protein